MSTIADSSAILTKDRVLPQHQAALTILQLRLADPSPEPIRWLDVACGRGQIIASLRTNLSSKARAKLEYTGFDVNSQYVKQTRQLAESLELGRVETKVGDLGDFNVLLPPSPPFDFITFTNSAHEVEPDSLAAVLVDSTLRLSPRGVLFIYDMESPTPPELGAIPWRRDEFKVVIAAMLAAFGSHTYEPDVGGWPHRTTDGWSTQIQREFISSANIAAYRESAIRSTSEVLQNTMRTKLASCRDALEQLTQYGSETENERENQLRLLYEFWSLSRALKEMS